MDFDWKNLVRGVAPTLATVLGTPAMGLGVKVLADALLGGGSGDPVKDEAAIAGVLAGGMTPEIRIKLIEAESKVKDQLHELRKLDLANRHEIDKLELQDLADARKRDSMFIQMGKRNWRADIMFGLAVLVVIILTVMVWHATELPEYTKGIITLVLGRFLGYLDQMYQFETGSTRTSKAKDETIERLSKRE